MIDEMRQEINPQIEKRINLSNQIVLTSSDILRDYRLASQSRYTSIAGRREVLSGKAKFGIFGGGKEIAQIAMARAFQKGDFRSGYYRDQTFMFALGESNIEQFFAQLYANADVTIEPHSGGRQMVSHFATRSLDEQGNWRNLTQMYNTSADISPTGGQMPRLVGLGYASRLYRELGELKHLTKFSRNGNEVAFGTIGNASCAEGLFWESLNAIGVLKSPVVLSIWDDEYGISVPNEFQITKGNLSELLKGFQREPDGDSGFEMFTVRGWDYSSLVEVYQKAAHLARTQHIPSIIHVIELTQPQGHSTSGSHERYKSEQRLQWEKERDCLVKMREWIVEQGIVQPGELAQIDRNARKLVENFRTKAWKAFTRPIYDERQEVAKMVEGLERQSAHAAALAQLRRTMVSKQTPFRKDIMHTIEQVLLETRNEQLAERQALMAWRDQQRPFNIDRFSSHLYGETKKSARHVPIVEPIYDNDGAQVAGFQVLNSVFEAMLKRDPRVVAFGEDLGFLGGVNQAFSGLQEKFGELRVADTGIREATIMGQAIGLAMRGLRPIAEIQYLDYILYALQIMSDDLATLHWRTKGGQKAPVIVRTRGHRLEGVWHSGSPMSAIVNLVRGMHVLVPRNMVQAAGFYNTLLLGDEPGLVVEVLNGYRLKERLPSNIGEMTIPLGVPELIREGEDLTIVTYGAMCQVALKTAVSLQKVGISAEVVDVRSLLPFDVNGRLLDSLKKTSRVIFTDEDTPGGMTAYMMQELLEKQGGFEWLDAEPRTLSAQPHRAPYGTDGNYFAKPNAETLFKLAYEMMHEADPRSYPIFYK